MKTVYVHHVIIMINRKTQIGMKGEANWRNCVIGIEGNMAMVQTVL